MNYLAYERNILVYHSLVGNHLYYGGDLKTVFDPKKLLKDQDCLYYPLDTDLEKRLGVSVGLLSSRISVGLMEKIDMDLVQDLVAK